MLLVPPSKNDLEGLTEAIYEQVNLESRRGNLSIYFTEGNGAAMTSDDAGGMKSGKRITVVGKHGEAGAGLPPQQSVRALVSVEPTNLHQRTRSCAVENEDGMPIDVSGNPIYAFSKGVVPLSIELEITVTRKPSSTTDDEDLEIIGAGQDEVLVKVMKMPSLAVADSDAAEALATSIAAKVKIVQDASGSRRFKL